MKGLSRKYFLSVAVVMVLVSASIGGFVYYFWKQGVLDENRSVKLSEMSTAIEEGRRSLAFEGVDKLINSSNYDKVKSELESEWAKLVSISKVSAVGISFELGDWRQKVLTSMEEAQKINTTADDAVMIKSKLSSFYSFVVSKGWKTLTKMSSDTLEQMRDSQGADGGSNSSLRFVEKSAEMMARVAKTSTIEDADKKLVAEKLEGIKLDIEKVRSQSKKKTHLLDTIREYGVIKERWLDTIVPALEIEKNNLMKTGKKMAMAMLAIAVGSLSMLALIWPLFQLFDKQDRKSISRSTKKILEDGVMRGDSQLFDSLEEADQQVLRNMSSYLQKRMGLSSLFQETLPFGAILLDNNLKVAWANQIFYDNFSISEGDVDRKMMSWDYVAQKTNIGEDDPVLDAIQKGNSGIFQIKVAAHEGDDALPYEMLVRPVKQDNVNFAMIFFYPLSSMEDTINTQARSFLAPIEKTLMRLVDDTFDGQFQSSIMHEFEIAKIGHLFDQFARLYEIIELEKKDLVQKMNSVHSTNEQVYLTFMQLVDMQKGLEEKNYEHMQLISQIKDDIIHINDINGRYGDSSQTLLQLLSQSLVVSNEMIGKEQKLISALKDALATLPEFEKIKVDFRTSRQDLRDGKNKVSAGLKELYGLKRLIADKASQAQYEGYVDRLKNDLDLLEQSESRLDKKLQSLEVMFSKMRLIFDGISTHLPDIERSHSREIMSSMREKEGHYVSSLKVMEEQTRKVEFSIVDRLRSIYLLMKSEIKQVNEMKAVLHPVAEVVPANTQRKSAPESNA